MGLSDKPAQINQKANNKYTQEKFAKVQQDL